MSIEKREHPKEKTKLHLKNKHRERYDFNALIASCPELKKHVIINAYNDESINFFNPTAIKTLNKAILIHHYGIENWDIPTGYLCPPIPGRADYIHYMAELLEKSREKNYERIIPTGKKIKCLDIGVGANCVYPILGVSEYDWDFVGSDIDPLAIDSAQKIIDSNPKLKGKIELRVQGNSQDIFFGIIKKGEDFDITICNPPFHMSYAAARAEAREKVGGLQKTIEKSPVLNFGGKNTELWCKGGEEEFIKNTILQSKKFSKSSFWFSTLVSKKFHLAEIYKTLEEVGALEVKTIPMGQGNKISRIVAWTFIEIKK